MFLKLVSNYITCNNSQ